MEPRQRALPVVAAVIEDRQGRILLAQRPHGKAEALRWEFPGGKIRPGEPAATALRRELIEELGFELTDCERFVSVHWRAAPRPLNLHAFRVPAPTAPIHAHEHLALAWVPCDRLVGMEVPAPDRPIVARLALPERYQITPEPDCGLRAFLDRLAFALEHSRPGALLFRAPGLAPPQRPKWAQAVLRRVRSVLPGTLVFLHEDCSLAQALGFDGAHLSSAALLRLCGRSFPRTLWLLASCHRKAELQHAQAVGVDAAVLGSVLPTQSHPGVRPLGWQAFRRLARSTWLPLYALGGVGDADLPQARHSGAHGIAGIRAFWS